MPRTRRPRRPFDAPTPSSSPRRALQALPTPHQPLPPTRLAKCRSRTTSLPPLPQLRPRVAPLLLHQAARAPSRSAEARTPRCSPGSPRSTSPSATSAPREPQCSGRPGRRGLSPGTCSSGAMRPAGCGKTLSSRARRC
jgi:hypothetical protein